jgi:hypothetical protein
LFLFGWTRGYNPSFVSVEVVLVADAVVKDFVALNCVVEAVVVFSKAVVNSLFDIPVLFLFDWTRGYISSFVSVEVEVVLAADIVVDGFVEFDIPVEAVVVFLKAAANNLFKTPFLFFFGWTRGYIPFFVSVKLVLVFDILVKAVTMILTAVVNTFFDIPFLFFFGGT